MYIDTENFIEIFKAAGSNRQHHKPFAFANWGHLVYEKVNL